MSMFAPHKKHAHQFTYVPRYYDPEKEAREQRRAELRGERSDDTTEYTPGKYIRTQRDARAARRAQRGGRDNKMFKLILILGVVVVLAYMLLPRIMGTFMQSASTPKQMSVEEYYGDFDPSAPITIVPNDYEE